MKRRSFSGFTLIEVLLVIAIIGILAVLVFAAAHAARDKAEDSRVKTDIAQLRRIAEDYFNAKNSVYTGYDTCALTPTLANCASTQTIVDSITTLRADLFSANAQVNSLSVSASQTSFCLFAPVKSINNQAVCSDSSGRVTTMVASGSCTASGSGPTLLYTCP